MIAAAVALASLVAAAAPAAAAPSKPAAAGAPAGLWSDPLFPKDGVTTAPTPAFGRLFDRPGDGLGCVFLIDTCPSVAEATAGRTPLLTAAAGVSLELTCRWGDFYQVRFKNPGDIPKYTNGTETYEWMPVTGVEVTSTFGPVPCGLGDFGRSA